MDASVIVPLLSIGTLLFVVGAPMMSRARVKARRAVSAAPKPPLGTYEPQGGFHAKQD